MASVGDGDTFWAQTERGCGVLIRKKNKTPALLNASFAAGHGQRAFVITGCNHREPRTGRRAAKDYRGFLRDFDAAALLRPLFFFATTVFLPFDFFADAAAAASNLGK